MPLCADPLGRAPQMQDTEPTFSLRQGGGLSSLWAQVYEYSWEAEVREVTVDCPWSVLLGSLWEAQPRKPSLKTLI